MVNHCEQAHVAALATSALTAATTTSAEVVPAMDATAPSVTADIGEAAAIAVVTAGTGEAAALPRPLMLVAVLAVASRSMEFDRMGPMRFDGGLWGHCEPH